jgi:inner membrane protein YidH
VSAHPVRIPGMARPPLRDVGEDPDPRLTFANERTFLAWNRTALALIGGGLAAAQLLDFDSDAVRLIVGLAPVLLGAVLAGTSYRRWEANERAMRLRQPLPSAAPPRWLSIALIGLAVVVALLVVVDAH